MPAFTRAFQLPDGTNTSVKYLEYSDMGSQTSQLGTDQSRTVCMWKVPWLGRQYAKLGLLGYTIKKMPSPPPAAPSTPYISRLTPHQHPDEPSQYARSVTCRGFGPLGTQDAGGCATYQWAVLETTYESYRCAILDDAAIISARAAHFLLSLRQPNGGTFTLTVTTADGRTRSTPPLAWNISAANLSVALFNLANVGAPAPVVTGSGPGYGVGGQVGGDVVYDITFAAAQGLILMTVDESALLGAGILVPRAIVTVLAPGGSAPDEALLKRFVVRRFKPESQILSTRSGAWFWLDGPSSTGGVNNGPKPVTFELPLRFARVRAAYTWLNIPLSLVNWAAIGQTMNKVNKSVFDPNGVAWPPGTTLFVDSILPDPKPLPDGQLGGDVVHNFIFAPGGWNNFPDPSDSNRLHGIGSANGQAFVFPRADFDGLWTAP